MAGYTAGSVTAEIVLDTKKFDEAISKLKTEVGELKTTFNSIKGSNGLDDEVKKLKDDINSLKITNNNFRDTIDRLIKENEKLAKGLKSAGDEADKTKKQFIQNTNAVKAVDEATRNFRKNFDLIKKNQGLSYLGKTIVEPLKQVKTATGEALASTKRFASEGGKSLKEFNDKLRENGQVWGTYVRAVNNVGTKADMGLNLEGMGFKGGKQALHEYLNEWSNAKIQVKRDAVEIENAIAKFAGFKTTGKTTAFKEWQQDLKQLAAQIKEVGHTYDDFNKRSAESMKSFVNMGNYVEQNRVKLELLHTGFNHLTQSIVKASEVLQTWNFKLLEGVDRESIFYQRTVQLASAMAKLNSGVGTRGANTEFQGRPYNYSQYLAQSEEVARALGKQHTTYQEIQGSQSKFAQGNLKSVSSLRQLTGQLNSSTNATNTLRRGMQFVDKETLRARYSVDSFGKGVKVTGEYTKLSDDILKGNNKTLADNAQKVRESGRGLTSFNNGIHQTAHSGRILSNTLYQIRGALLSLKMIFTAMGGMMLWGFAMDVAESVKETVTAKNEMEAQLNQNSKVDASGIQYFRKELDKLPKSFQKVNKYVVGETVSSIGLEFNLNAKQMAKALPIVTMVQSEYVRAGRKASEAALAVKDILQGEFQRLSRETGVGKEELIEYGWDEDKTNIDGLLRALEKAAKDRHWDVFAQKATSLNDVIEITKSRFSELGADVVDSITPAIVGGFNTIIDTINNLSNAFNSMGSFGRNFTFIGGSLAGFYTLGTLLPMITKHMGLAEIATIGWRKSLATAVLNLNKAEVAQYGFKKALAAVISGTSAAELSETRWTKAIAGRILGVNQGILAERGYKSAIFNKNVALRNGLDLEKTHINLGKASILNLETMTTKEMGRAQKLAYMTNNIKLSEAAEMGRGKAILRTATSWKVLGTAIKGVIALNVVVWLASIAAWADQVKKRVENYNDVLATGKDKIKGYKEDIESYQNKLDELTPGSKKYKKTSLNLEISKANLKDMENALELAKKIKKEDKELTKDNQNSEKKQLNKLYSANGIKNVEKYGHEYQKIKDVQDDITRSEKERSNFENASIKHIKEHVGLMKKAGLDEKARVKYITEYSTKAEEAANHLKQFNQGDMMAGVYYVMDRMSLMWIDLWNDKDFIIFWQTVQRTFNDLKPTLIEVKDALVEIGRNLMKYFSTDQGRWVGAIALAGGAFALIAYKLRGIVGPLKTVWGGLKKVGGKLKDVKDGWKKVGDEAEEATGKMGGEKSTGGIAGDSTGTVSLSDKLKGDVHNYVRAAVGIAAGMLLISEAIVLLEAPMTALANLGVQYKGMESQIRQGIEGLQLIAPTVIAIMIPVMALVKVMDLWGDSIINVKTLAGTAVGIAAGMLFVAEAVVMMEAPLAAIANLGNAFDNMEGVKQGIKAIKTLNEALGLLLPWIPVLAAGIALGVATFLAPEVMLLVDAGIVVGIAASMLLVAEAVVTMEAPLAAIANLGSQFDNLDNVEQGAKALKDCAKALGYVEDSMGSMAGIDWAMLGDNIARAVAGLAGFSLKDLTGEGGVLQELSDFVKEFNSDDFKIESPNPDKVTALSNVSGGIDTISKAMDSVQKAMDKIPNEFKNKTEGKTDVEKAPDVKGYFDTFKEPLKQLKDFVDDFNTSDAYNIQLGDNWQERVGNINKAADMISEVSNAVEKVKTTMQNVGGAGHETAFATGGGLSALGFDLFHMTGLDAINNGASSGDYVSSLGSSLKAMEDIIKDLFTFQSNVSQYGSSEGNSPDVGGLTNMVTMLQDAITNISNTLSNAMSTMNAHGKDLSAAIVNGFKEGLHGIPNVPAQIANKTMNNKDILYNNALSLGKTTANKFREGVNPMSEYMTWEISYVKTALTERHDELGQDSYDLGSYLASQFKSGMDSNSPGIIARTVSDELNYISQYFTDGMINLPQMAFDLGNLLSSNFNFDLNLSNFQLPNLDSFKQSLSTIIPMVDGVKSQVSTNFETMRTNVTNSFSGIVSKTQTSLSSMKTATVKNITNIKSSWKGMQDALIASAEHIKSQTASKIDKLKSNMGDFWNKIKNPDQLIGSGGGGGGAFGGNPMGSNRRRNRVVSGPTNQGYAGPRPMFKPKVSKTMPDDYSGMSWLCELLTGSPCFAGGWRFNWTPKIEDKFNNWNTHFNKFKLDDHLKVSSFKNSNFPVKGKADVFKDYIYEVIKGTTYDYYYNSRYSPAEALRRGSFNCYDGMLIVQALANAFGLGSSQGSGTWGKDGHVWAIVDGIGVVDTTAIQGGYGFKSPKVSGYGSRTLARNPPHEKQDTGDTYNTNVHIEVHGDDVEVNDRRIDKRTGKQLLDILGINPSTGR